MHTFKWKLNEIVESVNGISCMINEPHEIPAIGMSIANHFIIYYGLNREDSITEAHKLIYGDPNEP